MISSMITIGGHLTDRILCDNRGTALTLPNLYPSLYQFRLKLVDRDSTGAVVQLYPHVTALKASIGLVYAEPRAGTFRLRYAGTPEELTEPIDCRENPEDFRTKLAAISGSESGNYGLDVVYQPTPSTWVCRFLNPTIIDPGPPQIVELIPLEGYENELEPETFVRCRQFTQNAETWVEVRLLQGPIASTNDHDSVLPPPPEISTIRDGYTQDDGLTEIRVNEIQALLVPPDFNGTFFLKYQGRQSVALSANDGPQNIQTALNLMYGDNVSRFVVTNPVVNNAYIEFVGPFSGFNMAEMEITVNNPESNALDLTFPVNLYTTEVAEALRANSSVEAKFEVQLNISDPEVPEYPGQELVLFQAPVTIVRPLHWEGLEEAAPINWLYPPNPKDYIPFTQDQIGFGAVNYSQVFGNDTDVVYSIAHDLNTTNLQVSVRTNAVGPVNHQLTDEEFSVNFDDPTAITITLTGDPPGEDALVVVILSSGLQSVFSPHTHTIDQIELLRELLNSILSRLAALEALLPELIGLIPGTSPFGTDPSADIVGMDIKNEWDLIPTNRPPSAVNFDPTKLSSPGILLPAVHDVVDLELFTADPTSNLITLATDHPGLVAGQRARIFTPLFEEVGACTFHSDTNYISILAHGLVNDRQVKFQPNGGSLPESISTHVVYYVIESDVNQFKIAATPGGEPLALLIPDVITSTGVLLTVAEIPTGLLPAVDYYILAPTATPTTFKLSETRGGPQIDITFEGYPDVSISTVDEAPVTSGVLPDPGPLAGNVYAVKENVFLRGISGIRSETVHDGDFVASDGRMWYHVTRSDSPGSNSFYANQMEREIFRVAINEHMLAAGSIFTLTFDLYLQMFKHNTNVQFLLAIEIADIPQTSLPSPTGPNLFDVVWNKTPLMQQRIIVTDIRTKHPFGAQVIHKSDGSLRTNKKQYGVELAGDVIPSSPVFAMRARLIEFDTEDILDEENVSGTTGLVYWSLDKAQAGVTRGTPTTAPPTTSLP